MAAPPTRRFHSAPGPNHIVACLAYGQSAQHIRETIESLLDQSHGDLSVVVAEAAHGRKGKDPLRLIHDRRLIRIQGLPSPGQPWSSHLGADAGRALAPLVMTQSDCDWSDPDRAAILLESLREEHASGVVSGYREILTVGGRQRRSVVRRCRALTGPLTPELRERGPWCGLFTRASLERVGAAPFGAPPGTERLLLHLLLMTCHLAHVDEPLYVRRREIGDPGSRAAPGSARARVRAAQALERLYGQAFGDYLEYLGGTLAAEDLARQIRERWGAPVPAPRADADPARAA